PTRRSSDLVEDAVVRHDALETIGVAEHPVRHVTAIARAQRRLAVLVDEGIGLLDVIETLHQIFVRLATPIAADRIGELLAITGRAVEVDHHYDVIAGRGEQFRVPAIGPGISPRTLRPAVDQELQRIFFCRIEPGWANDEACDVRVVRAGERERLHRLHVDLREQRVVHVRDGNRSQIRGLWLFGYVQAGDLA